MVPEVRRHLLVFGGVAALFAWSRRAGLVALALVVLGIGAMLLREALGRRAARRRQHARLAQAMAEQGLAVDVEFHSFLGTQAFAVSLSGRKIGYASQQDTEIYGVDLLFEATTRKLAQGDFELGICVPGRISKQPNWRRLLVRSEREARRWTDTLRPLLGPRLSVDG